MSGFEDANTVERDLEATPIAVHWMYALLLDMGGCAKFVVGESFADTDIARALGVLWLTDAADLNNSAAIPSPASRRARQGNRPPDLNFLQQVLRALRIQQTEFNKRTPKPTLPEPLLSNVERLGELVGLDELEREILGLSTMLATDTMLYECCGYVGSVSFNKMLRILANLLARPQQMIRKRLSLSGALAQAGLIESFSRRMRHSDLEDLLQPRNMDLAFQLLHYRGDPIGLFSNAFRAAPAGTMQRGDYRHLGPLLSMSGEYLRTAMADRRTGVNVLLYGPPGTGKSELTRLLAKDLGAELFEISCTDEDGDPVDGFGRLCALRSAMCVLSKRRALLVMDEIEDMFGATGGLSGLFEDRPRHKGWTNRMLEENPLPCFWLTNNIDALDNAYVRRFNLVLKLDNPPRAQRLQLVHEISGGRVNERLAARLAEHVQLTPAVITRAIAVAGTIEKAAPDISTSVGHLVDATLAAQGFPMLLTNRCEALPAFYSPDLVNADHSLEELVNGLRHHQEARLCFYGPSGTGKTAFGLWVARQLGRPLYSRRASDLISPYIGMTERNLAAAFEAAAKDDAVLLLDEVDTFLQDRRRTQHSWEVSAVNEMLTQMEAYRGLFIASTNLMENLDQASLRRFDLKVHFGFLKADQISVLLDKHLTAMDLKRPATLALGRLLRQRHVTPGDFDAISRRSRFKPFRTATEVIEAIIAEAASKGYASVRPIGFVH